jgi:GH3 auxin-responsive promoter
MPAAALIRRAADFAFGRYARRRARTLDHLDVAGEQQRTLLRLVRHARRTQFGCEHDFHRIRTVADYQRRVPLRDYDAFWQTYWRPAFPRLCDVTWPGLIPYFALSSGTTSGATKYVPVSREMLASNRRAALTTLALFLAVHPGTPLFRGRIFFLGGSTELTEPAEGVLAGDLSGIAAREVSSFLRPYTFPPLDLALMRDWDQKMRLLAERSAVLPITAISGVPSWLLVLFERLREITGRERLIDIWPSLRLVIHGGTKFDPYRKLFRQVIGSDDVQLLEVYPASEGYVASEDPRHGFLRLLPDHGVFFEFVPVDELSSVRPTRHTVADVVPGVQYAIVMTTCAGLWSYVLGDTVCFERRDPPLLRFTGRTRYFLSAFGEHLISEEVERAVALAAEATDATVADFHVGPVFPESPAAPGHHRYLVEFVQTPADVGRFAEALDAALCRLNEDYAAHRAGDLTMQAPEVVPVPRGGFAEWLRARGKVGGQHKVPRMDNSGGITAELSRLTAQRISSV